MTIGRFGLLATVISFPLLSAAQGVTIYGNLDVGLSRISTPAGKSNAMVAGYFLPYFGERRPDRALVNIAAVIRSKVAGVIYWNMSETKIHDESHKISDKRGNGSLRREVWIDRKGKVTRYNLAYVNHNLHAGDNGRVVGYDNAHGFHHRHYFGGVEPIDFTSYEDVEERFELDWTALKGSK